MSSVVLIAASSGAVGFVAGVLVGQIMNQGSTAKSGAKKQDKRKRAKNGKSVELYVGNLPYQMSEKALTQAFEAHGKVKGVRIIKNNFNGKSKGFGFVQMASRSDADAAIKSLDGENVQGRRLVVNEAKSNKR